MVSPVKQSKLYKAGLNKKSHLLNSSKPAPDNSTANHQFNYINSGSYSMPNGGRSENNSSQGLIEHEGSAGTLVESAAFDQTPHK